MNKMNSILVKFIFVCLMVFCIFDFCDARKKKKLSKGLLLRRKETNPVNFMRLVVMRLIYGIATRVGFGEQISEALGGAFVPPGVDDYDYGDGGLGFFEREDDYDY